MEQVLKGTVVWFNGRLGYGFIKRDDGKTDLFVHYSDINITGFKVLMAGDVVIFTESYNYQNKIKAANVSLVERKRK